MIRLSASIDTIGLADDGDRNSIGGLVQVIHNDYTVFDRNVGDNLTAIDNIADDPLLDADFHLQDSSPCNDTGGILVNP